jgi:hypothetical protein
MNRPALLGLSSLLLTVLLTVSCVKRANVDGEALSAAVTLNVVSYQGPRTVRVRMPPSPSAWKSGSGESLDNALRTISDSENEIGIALLDATYAPARARLAELLGLLDAEGHGLDGLPDQLPEGGANSIFRLAHHAVAPTKLMERDGQTPSRLGQAATTTGADLAGWINVTCSIRDNLAEATASVLLANQSNERVAWGDGVGEVHADESLNLPSAQTSLAAQDVAVSICRPAVERAIERIAQKITDG